MFKHIILGFFGGMMLEKIGCGGCLFRLFFLIVVVIMLSMIFPIVAMDVMAAIRLAITGS